MLKKLYKTKEERFPDLEALLEERNNEEKRLKIKEF